MALNIADLSKRTVKHSFEFDGEPVSIEFYPHKLTPEYMAGLDTEIEDDERRSGDAKMLAEVLVAWDVMAGDDPLPPTYDNLLRAPSTLVTRTAFEIVSIVGKLATPPKSRK